MEETTPRRIVTDADRVLAEQRLTTQTVSPHWPPRTRSKRETKAQRVIRRLEQPDFEGKIIGSVPSYRQAEETHKARTATVDVKATVQIQSYSRCRDCDRLYVVSGGKVVCPSCGQVDDTQKAIKMICDAFNPPSGDAA